MMCGEKVFVLLREVELPHGPAIEKHVGVSGNNS